jgi:hypothetical protein
MNQGRDSPNPGRNYAMFLETCANFSFLVPGMIFSDKLVSTKRTGMTIIYINYIYAVVISMPSPSCMIFGKTSVMN